MKVRLLTLSLFSLFLAVPLLSFVSPSKAAGFSCIDVELRATMRGSEIARVYPSAEIFLDGRYAGITDASGRLRITHVSTGVHRVTDRLPAGWGQFLVSPSNGTVMVHEGVCSIVTFAIQRTGLPVAAIPVTPLFGLCNDDVDNDRDGLTDRRDADCYIDGNVLHPGSYDVLRTERSFIAASTRPQCADTYDNDRDGLIDYPRDTGCFSRTDSSEFSPVASAVGSVALSIRSNAMEVLPGGTVWFTVRVNNGGTSAKILTTEAYFDPAQLEILRADGALVSRDTLRWNLSSLAPNEAREFQFLARVNPTLSHLASVRVRGSVTSSIGTRTASTTLAALRTLPQTGISLFSLFQTVGGLLAISASGLTSGILAARKFL